MADNVQINQNSTEGPEIATDEIAGVQHQRVKAQFGADGSATDVSSANPFPVREQVLDGRFKAYSDTGFVSGDSPATIDANTDLGRDGSSMLVINDGPGDFTVAVSNDGVTYSDEWTMKAGESFPMSEVRIDSIRITHVADSAYRVMVI